MGLVKCTLILFLPSLIDCNTDICSPVHVAKPKTQNITLYKGNRNSETKFHTWKYETTYSSAVSQKQIILLSAVISLEMLPL